ncbi:hypothetical protein RV10_GL004249 [Enterococcus pallens]|nr:hypothetical protein RV10_GL004249 [Enterococcus pallens]
MKSFLVFIRPRKKGFFVLAKSIDEISGIFKILIDELGV